MANEGREAVPVAVVDRDQFNEIMARLDRIDEKIEFYSGEKFLRAGKSVGRDLGTAYGVMRWIDHNIGVYTVRICRPLDEGDLNVQV